LEAEDVFVGMGEGGGCAAVGDGFMGVGLDVGGSGEGTKVERATLRVDPSKVGVGGKGRWAALEFRGSRGKRSQAAREPKRRAVKMTTTPTPLLNQPLFAFILSPRKGVEQCSCPTPMTAVF
jgi:hypothetical protein